MATIIYDVAANGTGQPGTLFQGLTFWLSQRVPQRSRFIAQVEVRRQMTILTEKLDMLILP